MKRTILIVILSCTCLLRAQEDGRDQLWKDVEDAVRKRLPQTAIEKLETIIARAAADDNQAELIKAIGKKIVLEGQIQGGKAEEIVARLQTAVAAAPEPAKPVLTAILANWYWQFFQQNRWRFMNRTQTATPPGDDLMTWDLARIFAEIDKQFQLALSDTDTLQKTAVTDYDELLVKGTAPDTYRPTMYDFLAHEALAFYSAGEQAGAKAEDAFELSADSPILAAADEFMAWRPPATDETSPTVRAVRLYQDLLRFHRQDADRSAFLDADLLRLEFGYNMAFGEEKAARYKALLQRFADAHVKHPLSARALAALAQVVHGEGDLVEARRIAAEGLARFPDSVGGKRCFNLIQQIEARQLQVTAERVWNHPLQTVDVTYRNLTKIYFRVVPFDFEAFAKSGRWRPEQLDQKQRDELVQRQPVQIWSANLPATEDYRERHHQVPTPKDLPTGSYYLLASDSQSFSAAANQLSIAEFWVSDLALVIYPDHLNGLISGLVLQAQTGEPLAGATVSGWSYQGRKTEAIAAVKTDQDGAFQLSVDERRQFLLYAAFENQKLSSQDRFSVYRQGRQRESTQQTIFFTDRALYRPGQTIRFKGICIDVDQDRDNYEVLADREVAIVFQDVNGKEIEQLKLRSNAFGSFSGSVTAPRDRLMGRMLIRVAGQPPGSVTVTVEEYKRPKFQVAVAPPTAAARLQGEVRMLGKAASYTGAAVNDAKVRWRVVRQVRYPDWWFCRCWWLPPQPDNSQEIAHGTATTAADGSFEVAFTARADASVAAAAEPIFRFTVYADVTDTTGETRSASQTINVGYTALAASLQADDWQTVEAPVTLSVSTTTLDGSGQSATGTIRIFQVQQPEQVQRPELSGRRYYYGAGDPPAPDAANPDSWPLGELTAALPFTTDADGKATVTAKLGVGLHRAKLETTDRFGKAVTAELPLRVLDPSAKHLALKIPNLVAGKSWSLAPGETFSCIWGSGYETARALVEVEHRGKLLQHYWTDRARTQTMIEQEVSEAMRGGFTVYVTMVRENRAYLEAHHVDVPWTNKDLTLSWEHFVSKLAPAQQETWTAIVKGPDAAAAVAEMVAALYDASLDAYSPHQWPAAFNVFRTDYSQRRGQFENQLKQLQVLWQNWQYKQQDGSLQYRQFPPDIARGGGGRGALRRQALAGGMLMEAEMSLAAAPMMAKAANAAADAADSVDADFGGESAGFEPEAPPTPDLSKVSARRNLNETAFFMPHLLVGEDGTVRIEFTMPEALTEWKFLGFAHDRTLRAGLLTATTVTAKELMVQPNPPRFLREGDVVEFTVKVSNQSAQPQTGNLRLTLADAVSGKAVDAALGNTTTDQAFAVAAGESRSYAWQLTVPDGLGVLSYKAVGATATLSDGEEGYLPVLPRRVLVTESLPLPIRGAETKTFDFTRLLASGQSDSLRHQSLTVQMVSNPAWYAVMALPYLMDFPHQCSEQTFNRLYANALAQHIAASDPKIRRVFDRWRDSDTALVSPLEKNEDLKAVMLEETPWLRQGADESQARRNVGILFDSARLADETQRLLQRLAELQDDQGRWSWFPGGRGNDYITLYITTGFGRLRHLGVTIDVSSALASIQQLDQWVTDEYNEIAAARRSENHLSSTIALYLYGRSFFLVDRAVAKQHREAFDYWVGQAQRYWTELGCRQSMGHVAIALNRLAQVETAKAIMASIKEHAVTDEELGMFWRDTEASWWWYRAPIETQALMIEAFAEVTGDEAAVADCRVWLLKQKQTQDWRTTKATADAVYALLLRGTDILAADAVVSVSLGGETIKPATTEAGTGFYESRFAAAEVRPELGGITVRKTDPGVAWGSIHWQYFEDMSKVTAHDGTPLQLTKSLFRKQASNKGPVLVAVDGAINVGDELIVRVVLRTDRDMEYVHLKDYRGSGTEPVNVLSSYKFQDGLYYYESTRDAASHFFIDYLPKGVYVFEYAVRVQLRGHYQTGFAAVQCMYAPEFNSHSESLPLTVE